MKPFVRHNRDNKKEDFDKVDEKDILALEVILTKLELYTRREKQRRAAPKEVKTYQDGATGAE